MQLYVQSAVVERGVGPDELNAERAEVDVRLDLREPGRELHHHRHRRDAVPARRAHHHSAAEAAKALEPFAGRYAEVLFARRAARREPARRRDPAGHRRLRDRRDVRVREGHQPPPARGAGVRRRHHRPDRDRHDRRDHPRHPGDRLLVGVQVVNGALLPVLLFFVWRLASEPRADGRLRNGRVFNVIAGATVSRRRRCPRSCSP